MKTSFVLATAVLFTCLLFSGVSHAGDKGPAEMVLHSTVDPAKKAKLAFFPHAEHQQRFDCATCHHSKDDKGQQIAFVEDQKIETCDTCHNTKSGINKKLNTFKKAAHARCKACHKALKKEGKEAGPTKCKGCHRKGLK